MNKDKKNDIVVHSLKSESLTFPEKSQFITDDYSKKMQNCIQENAVRDDNGKTAINTKAIKDILCTDIVGAKKFYNRLAKTDKFESNKEKYVKTTALKNELNERIEKPFDIQKRENMKENDRYLNAVRDNTESEKIRSINESKIRHEQKSLKKRKIKKDNISKCQHSGEPLEPDAHAHHKERRADNPDLALDLNNIEIVNNKPHNEHHKKERDIDFN